MKWTEKEDEVLIKFDGKSAEDIVEMLPRRTISAVQNRFKILRKSNKITIGLRVKCECQNCEDIFYNTRRTRFCDSCIEIDCEVCGTRIENVREYGSDISLVKYCSKQCANIGQARNRIVWCKGLTKHDDERLMNISRSATEQMKHRGKGENHPMFGKKHSEESKKLMAQNNQLKKMKEEGKEIPDIYKKGLDKGRTWCKGLTKHDHPSLAERGLKVSKAKKGKDNPEHSKRMKVYYKKHPEKHPNRILANKKDRTYIEQIMFDKLTESGVIFQEQFRILSYYADFALPDIKLVIECDGERWHDEEKDKIRDARLNEEGWTVLRFKGKELVGDADRCKKITLNKINELKRLIS